MPLPADHDVILESLHDDLRARLTALNDLYHPVYPADPARIAEVEGLVQEQRAAIAARRAELGGESSRTRAPTAAAVPGTGPTPMPAAPPLSTASPKS